MKDLDDSEGGKAIISDFPISFSLKKKEKRSKPILGVLKFMRKLSNFEKKSAESNLLVGRKKA